MLKVDMHSILEFNGISIKICPIYCRSYIATADFKTKSQFSILSTMQSVISNSSFIIFEQKKLSVVLFENANLDRGIVQILEVS